MAEHALVIVGGGLTSARAIKSYRESGGDGRVLLVSRDTRLPYHRPPLSKRYLRGEIEAEGAYVEQPAFYEENEVDVELETAVAAVDASAHEIELEAGHRVGYGRLLIATGAYPRPPRAPGSKLAGVHVLRTLDDSTQIREAAADTRDAVVVGGSFIGLETAASLRQLGLDVTLLHRGSDLLEVLRAPHVASYLHRLAEKQGVNVVLGDEVAEFGGRSRVDSVTTKGGRTIPADLVVVGFGVDPAISFLDGSGIEVADGVVVGERYETNAPDVYAAGDVAQFFDPLFDRRRRIEHWSNANYQGAEVGKVLAGADGGYDTVSSFFTEFFGFAVRLFGDNDGFDELVVRGAWEEGRGIGFYLDGDRLVAAVVAEQDEETESRLKELIAAHATATSLEALADDKVALDDALAVRGG